MKFLNQSVLALSVMGFATVAMAASDPIIGKWKTAEGAIVQITQSGSTYNGTIVSTVKDQSLVGTVAIRGLKADGGGKYSGGQGKHPVFGNVKMTAVINGNTMTVTGKKLGFKKNQVWKKQ